MTSLFERYTSDMAELDKSSHMCLNGGIYYPVHVERTDVGFVASGDACRQCQEKICRKADGALGIEIGSLDRPGEDYINIVGTSSIKKRR